MRAPRCSNGIRSDQRPRLPPAMDGEAESSKPCISLKGWGSIRETQSTAFFRTPGMEALYSGEEMTNASQPTRRRLNSRAPLGGPDSSNTSPLNDGESKLAIEARPPEPPLGSMVSAARSARRAFIEP